MQRQGNGMTVNGSVPAGDAVFETSGTDLKEKKPSPPGFILINRLCKGILVRGRPSRVLYHVRIVLLVPTHLRGGQSKNSHFAEPDSQEFTR